MFIVFVNILIPSENGLIGRLIYSLSADLTTLFIYRSYMFCVVVHNFQWSSYSWQNNMFLILLNKKMYKRNLRSRWRRRLHKIQLKTEAVCSSETSGSTLISPQCVTTQKTNIDIPKGVTERTFSSDAPFFNRCYASLVTGGVWLVYSRSHLFLWVVTRSHPLSCVVTLCHELSWIVILGLFSHVCHSCWYSITRCYSFTRLVTHLHASLPFLIACLVQFEVVFGCSFHVIAHCHDFFTRYFEFSLLEFFSNMSLLLMFLHTWLARTIHINNV
jgi:hypothetical protein